MHSYSVNCSVVKRSYSNVIFGLIPSHSISLLNKSQVMELLAYSP